MCFIFKFHITFAITLKYEFSFARQTGRFPVTLSFLKNFLVFEVVGYKNLIGGVFAGIYVDFFCFGEPFDDFLEK